MTIQNVVLHKRFIVGLVDNNGNVVKFLDKYDSNGFSILYKESRAFTTYQSAKEAAIEMANKGIPVGHSLNVMEVHTVVECSNPIAHAYITDLT